MPFTLSHPAAVLPFRRYGVFSALILGSMAPDFLYFIPGHAYGRFGHTGRGLFVFTLPAAWIALIVFHWILKRPLAELFPESIARKLRAAAKPFDFGIWPFNLGRIAAISASALAAAVLHVLWDSFTHANGYFAEEVPFLMAPLFQNAHGTVLRVQLFQEISTWFGAIAIIWSFRAWLADAPLSSQAGTLPSWARFGIPAAIGILALLYSVPLGLGPLHYQLTSYLHWEYFLRITVVTGMRTAFILLFLYCVTWHAVAARHSAAPPAG